MKPVGIFGNNISKCPDIMRKRTPISLHWVPPVRRKKVKDYVSSVGSPCMYVSLWRNSKMRNGADLNNVMLVNNPASFNCLILNTIDGFQRF